MVAENFEHFNPEQDRIELEANKITSHWDNEINTVAKWNPKKVRSFTESLWSTQKDTIVKMSPEIRAYIFVFFQKKLWETFAKSIENIILKNELNEAVKEHNNPNENEQLIEDQEEMNNFFNKLGDNIANADYLLSENIHSKRTWNHSGLDIYKIALKQILQEIDLNTNNSRLALLNRKKSWIEYLIKEYDHPSVDAYNYLEWQQWSSHINPLTYS